MQATKPSPPPFPISTKSVTTTTASSSNGRGGGGGGGLSFFRFLWSLLSIIFSWLTSRFFQRSSDSHRSELVVKRKSATTYDEWRRWAREIDDFDGYQTWRTEETTALFNFDEVASRIRTLTELRKRRDFAGLLAELSADFHRKMCGVTNPLLYSKYRTGTKTAARSLISLLKRLISDIAAPAAGSSSSSSSGSSSSATTAAAASSSSIRDQEEKENEEPKKDEEQQNIKNSKKSPATTTTKAPLTREEKLSAVADLSRAYGHTALILNSSAAFGFYHLGVIKCLHEQQLLPRVVFGRKSGAIAAAFLCCPNLTTTSTSSSSSASTSSSAAASGNNNNNINNDSNSENEQQEKRDDNKQKGGKEQQEAEQLKFLDPDKIDGSAFVKREKVQGPGFWRRIHRLFSEGTLMDSSVVLQFVRDNIGDITFEEAYRKTGRVLNIFVSKRVGPNKDREAGWLLNYLTAPSITVASAAVASCRETGIYPEMPLMTVAQRGGGSLIESVPASLQWAPEHEHAGVFHVNKAINRLRHLFNVNFFIVSEASFTHLPWFNFRNSTSLPGQACNYVMEEVYRFSSFFLRNVFRANKLAAWVDALNEPLQGDVVILPITSMQEVLQCLTNPSRSLLKDCSLKSEKCLWPRVEEIRANMELENALRDAMIELHGSQNLTDISRFSALEHFTF